MSRERKILLCVLVLLIISIGVGYFLFADKNNVPVKDMDQLTDSVKVDSVAVVAPSVADGAVVVQKPVAKKPVAKKPVAKKPIKKTIKAKKPKKTKKTTVAKPKIKPIEEPEIEPTVAIEDIVKIDFGSIGKYIEESQKEVKNIEKQGFVFEPIDLPEVSHTVSLKYQRVDRPSLFVPKGQWLFGGTVQYSDHTNVNYKLLVLDDWDGKGYSTSGNIYAGYAVKDNLALGVKAGFGRTLLNIDNINANLGDDLNFGVDHAHYLDQNWSGSFFMRNFISLFGSRQFGLFNDTEITLSGGRGKTITGTGEMLKGTYQSSFDASIGISPGIMVFMQNVAAIEISVGLLGFKTGVTKQKTNQVYEGSRRTSGIKFGVDALSIKLGATFYINDRNFQQR